MKNKTFISDPKRIIVRMPNWIGDIVMTIPILEDLRCKFPKAHITAMVKYPFSDLLLNNLNIDEIFSFKKDQKKEIIQKLRIGNYGLGILLTNSFSSALWFFKGKVKNRIGYAANLRRLFLTKPLKFSKNRDKQHLIKTYKEILLPLNIDISQSEPKLFLFEEDNQKAKNLLFQNGYKSNKKLIGINTGAAYGSAKCWPLERYAEVAKRLLEDENNYVVFVGERSIFEKIEEICKTLNNRAINLCGKTSIRELMAIINSCHLFLTNDSGPMHIASALRIPLIAIFGSTSDVITGPLSGIVINKKVKCSPCFRRECNRDFECMKNIEEKDIIEKIAKLLNM